MASMVSKLISDGEVQLAETVVREPALHGLLAVQQQRMGNPDFDASSFISHYHVISVVSNQKRKNKLGSFDLR
jgi:hypothetical protein